MINNIILFSVRTIITTSVLYYVTHMYLGLEKSSFLKALIITVTLNIVYLLFSLLIGNPTGFHSSMFASIAKYLYLIPHSIMVYIAYSMSMREFGYYFIASFIAGFIISPLTSFIIIMIRTS
ncbi:MAG: hypothetical protein U9P73_01860 [Candidatus Cloacimonadota bacterium]|nr:hypothetical protein [Candidatus Cloacimonadota bacterium]